VVKFAKVLQLSSTDSETLMREMNQRKMIFLVTNCPSATDAYEMHSVTTDFFKEMIKKNSNLKLIFITDEEV
jgi:hypothetical protein